MSDIQNLTLAIHDLASAIRFAVLMAGTQKQEPLVFVRSPKASLTESSAAPLRAEATITQTAPAASPVESVAGDAAR